MENRQDIRNELNSISPFWATVSHAHPYTVPVGYFEGLPGQIAEQAHPALPYQQLITYTVPDGYFDALAGAVLSGIRKDEVAVIRSNEKKTKQESPVIFLKNARRSMRYAAAVVVAVILTGGLFLLTNLHPDKKYLQADIPRELNKLSENELLKYLGSHEHAVIAPEKEIFATDEFPDVKEGIQQMSDEELNQYLNESAEPLSAGLMESNS